jgi:hypothetical protein
MNMCFWSRGSLVEFISVSMFMTEAGLSDFSYSLCSAPARVFSASVHPIRIPLPDIMPRYSLAPLRLIGDQLNAGPRVHLFQGMSISLGVYFFFLQILLGFVTGRPEVQCWRYWYGTHPQHRNWDASTSYSDAKSNTILASCFIHRVENTTPF